MNKIQAIKFDEYQPGLEDFGYYAARLNYCFIANGIVTEERKRANFYTVCGAKVFEIALALIAPRKSNQVSYTTVIQLLNKHFTPKANEITMTYKFYNRNQRGGEKACDYIIELRKIAKNCNFSHLERNLRDRLVCGMQDEKLQCEMLKRDNLTYQEVVKAMKAAEQSSQNIHEIKM